MKRNSLTLLLAAGMLLAGVQTAKAQKQGSTAEGKVKVVLHMAGNQTFECSISQLDSITFVGDDLIIEEEHEWVDLGLPSGTLWATCNVGANSPEEYGDYFAWGETEPKAYYSLSTYKFCEGTYNTNTKYCTKEGNGIVDNKLELEPIDDVATNKWGSGWQVPSKEQFKELIKTDNCVVHMTTQAGVEGWLITSKSNNNSIFLPAIGYFEGSNLYYLNEYGCYWSRSLNTNSCDNAHNLLLHPSVQSSESYHERYLGQPVRPVRVQRGL